MIVFFFFSFSNMFHCVNYPTSLSNVLVTPKTLSLGDCYVICAYGLSHAHILVCKAYCLFKRLYNI